MPNLSGIMKQLKKERDRVEKQLSGLNAALVAFAGVYRTTTGAKSKTAKQKRSPMSAKARAAISRAQKARWAKQNSKDQTGIPPKRKMSMAARAKIAAAQKARWKSVRAAQK